MGPRPPARGNNLPRHVIGALRWVEARQIQRGVVDLEASILDGAGEPVIGAGAPKGHHVAARLQHTQHPSPKSRRKGHLARVPVLPHEAGGGAGIEPFRVMLRRRGARPAEALTDGHQRIERVADD